MIEKWLPASLKNTGNSFYENFLIEAENMVKEFTDQKVKSISNIYSISKGSKENIINVASNIYLLDKNILNSILNFLTQQFDYSVSLYPSQIKDLISVYFQLNLIEYEIGNKPKGLFLQEPVESDFSDHKMVEKFIEVISYSVPNITITLDEDTGIFYFVYPMYNTEEIRENIKMSLYNAICGYAINYKIGFELFLGKDPVNEGYIKSFIHSMSSFTIEFNHFDTSIADDLGQIIKFSIPYCDYNIDTQNIILNLTYRNAEDIALEVLKDEISKIPNSISYRGTKKFYESIFHTLNYVYPGIISLLKTKDNSRIGKLISNINLNRHPQANSQTDFVAIPVDEKYNAIEEFINTLDDESLDPELNVLDSSNIFNRLDQISQTEETLYKKDILIGFSLNKNNFYGKSIYPYEFSRFILEMINLNQKTTDVIHLTPIISIDIDKDQQNEIVRLPRDNPFISVYNTNESYSQILETNPIIRMDAFEYDESTGEYHRFYDYYLQDLIDFKFTDFALNEKVLTYNALIEGKRYRASNILCEVESTRKIICNLGNRYSNYITKKMIIKLMKDEEYYMLFKQVDNRYFEQCDGPMDSNGNFLYPIVVKLENNTIILESEVDFASLEAEYQITFSSDKLQTKIGKIQFSAVSENDERLLDSFSFENNETNLSIDLPANVNLMLLVSRHEGV